jgi:hypothetical protein
MILASLAVLRLTKKSSCPQAKQKDSLASLPSGQQKRNKQDYQSARDNEEQRDLQDWRQVGHPGRPHMGYLLSGPDGDLGVTAGAAVCPSLRRPGLDQRTLGHHC